MELNSLSKVQIESNSSNYLVAKVSDGNGGVKIVVRAKPLNDADILAGLQKEADGLKVECLGGGLLRGTNENGVHICDCSPRYGQEPNRELTLMLFQAARPDVTFTVGTPS